MPTKRSELSDIHRCLLVSTAGSPAVPTHAKHLQRDVRQDFQPSTFDNQSDPLMKSNPRPPPFNGTFADGSRFSPLVLPPLHHTTAADCVGYGQTDLNRNYQYPLEQLRKQTLIEDTATVVVQPVSTNSDISIWPDRACDEEYCDRYPAGADACLNFILRVSLTLLCARGPHIHEGCRC